MSAQQIITDHDLWRKGVGGAAASLVGQSDNFAYAGLDLNLAQFASSNFCGTSFSDTTFQRAGWSDCTFVGCTFTHCDFQFIAISGCTFVDCNFSASKFDQSSFNDVQFDQCCWIPPISDPRFPLNTDPPAL
ncbi:pentapeptide repeat-containing protein [Acidovorax cavernicola]|uniref:Pentapeptide repeat-containing protein n=1 Tax=Acidovorax cavernicola TaxID=1675792 RepID=A0A9X8GWA6_9BURK|nr:pentapeptide repeat-containing protein [Acidovorax cavernicola]RIX83301.1 hypothetical protein D3H34_06925 [Acidovorax cavernicola]